MSLQTLAVSSQIAGAVIFLVLAVVLWNKFLAPAVTAYTASKNAEIADAEVRREQMKAEITAAHAEVASADSDVAEIRARLTTIAQRERAAALAAGSAEAERIVRNAQGELERARIAARDKLRIEFIEKALAKARTDAVSRVDAPLNARLVKATIDDVAGGKA